MAMAIPKIHMKIADVKRLLPIKQRSCQRKTSLRYSMSCPNLMAHAKVNSLRRYCSPCRTKPICDEASTSIPPTIHGNNPKAALSVAFACKCPCPFPCGPCGNSCGCCCLPPPCNTPPKCIQYMTGYYYYPYGFWFCGPYHVQGLCYPVNCCAKCPCPCPCPPCPSPCPCWSLILEHKLTINLIQYAAWHFRKLLNLKQKFKSKTVISKCLPDSARSSLKFGIDKRFKAQSSGFQPLELLHKRKRRLQIVKWNVILCSS